MTKLNEINMVAIIKNKKVYAKEKDKYGNYLERIKLRFDAGELKSFDKKWKVFTSVPTKVEHLVIGYKTIIRYQLKDGYTATEKTPETMTREAFNCCGDDCKNPEIVGLYEPVYRKELDYWRSIELNIEIIDMDCEPLINQKYNYKVRFPGYIDKHMIVFHTVPCYIKGDDAFKYIAKAVKENIPDHCFMSSNFDFHLKVDMIIPQIKPLKPIQKVVLEIATSRWSYGCHVQDIDADNYYELEKKMDALIKTYVDKMKQKIKVCPTCGGCGWIDDV